MSMQFGFIGCGLTFLGMILALIGIIGVAPARRSLRWHTAPGTIERAGSASPAPGQGSVRYRYTAAGREYSGSRVAFARFGPPAPSAYRAGQPVTVYYDPAAPDRSVLEPGPGPLGFLPVALGGLFFVAGLLLGMVAYVVY